MNLFDTQLEKAGTKGWHQVDITEKKESEVVEEFGGPCRGRTYGPLIKSSDQPQPEPTQDELSQRKNEESSEV